MTSRSDMHIAKWLEEDREEDFIDGPAGTDDDIDHIEEQLDSTGTEYSVVEDKTNVNDKEWEGLFSVIEGSDDYHLDLEGNKWMKEPIKTQSDYVPNIQSGPTDYARSRKTQCSCFDLFFDENIIYMISKYTNDRIFKEQKTFARERDAKLTDEVEIYALLGIFFFSGCAKMSRGNFLQLFDAKKGTGIEAVYLAMSFQRYRFLMKNLRFHDPTTDRQNEDKIAPIRVLFQLLVNNFQKHFTPSHELNLGDLVTPYKGRCAFRQYMPKKPVKFGIKMFALVDCQYPYTYNLEVYVGDNPGPYEVANRKLDIVVRMTDPIQGEYRNVTMSNWFTSLETAEVLFYKKITIVGAIRPDKNEVPRIFRTIKEKNLHSSLFGYYLQSCCTEIKTRSTLVQYVCKPNKSVLLISSKHCDGAINSSSGDQLIPEILVYYNRTKKAVDTVESMCSKADVTRNSRRWPLNVFFRLLNLAAINALCVFTINKGQERIVRREFLTELALSMIKPLVHRRMHSEVIPRIIKQKMYEFLGFPLPLDVELQIDLNDKPPTCGRIGPRGRCHVCRRGSLSKTTREVCVTCNKYTCFQHSKYMCCNCYNIHSKYYNEIV